MRRLLFVALAAATALASPAAARPHEHGHDGNRHGHERGNHERHWREHFHGRHYRAYAAPHRNWSYRRVRVGYRLRPEYYAPRYVISNYGHYGLRAPGRYLRWVQYGPDLLLVDMRYGRVVEVIPGRFY